MERLDQTLPTLKPRQPVASSVPNIDLAGATHIGCVRKRNEDQYLIATLGRWLHPIQTSVGAAPDTVTHTQGTLLVVADGMGGHGGGDVASAVTVDALASHALLEMPWHSAGTPEGDRLLAEDIQHFALACQQRLVEVARRKQLPEKLGTTLTVAYLRGSTLTVAHVGDSRAYVLREGRLVRLTEDHTLAAALNIDGGGVKNVLTNCIGGNHDAPRVDLHTLELVHGDRVMLSSDGLHGLVPEPAIEEILRSSSSSHEACERLIQAALDLEAPDNVTVLAAFG